MADERQEPQTVISMSPAQAAARQIQKELADMEAKGIKLTETKPGGHFIGTDGEPHDSEGRKIGSGKVAKMSVGEAQDRLAKLKDEQAALEARVAQANAEAQAEAANAAANPDANAADEDDEKKAARKSAAKGK